jgi:predicted outer membrane repeat protein
MVGAYSSISDNKVPGNIGGGVYMGNGTFTMGYSIYSSINNNTAAKEGGGVYMENGTFTMDGEFESIRNNKTTQSGYNGGGVAVIDGHFIVRAGMIIDNQTFDSDASESGTDTGKGNIIAETGTAVWGDSPNVFRASYGRPRSEADSLSVSENIPSTDNNLWAE